MQSKIYQKSVLITGLIGLLVLGAIIFNIKNKSHAPLESYQTKFSESISFHNSGDLDKSVNGFSQLENIATSLIQKINAELFLALDLYRRNQNGDRVKAGEIWKSIITDSNAKAIERAIAAAQLLERDDNVSPRDFAVNVIFKDAPFGDLLKNNDLDDAIRLAYEATDKIYPLAITDFHLSKWYALQLWQKKYSNESEKKKLVEKLKFWIKKGESDLDDTIKLKYGGKSFKSYIYQLQAESYWALAKFDSGSYEQVENKFKESLSALLPEDSDIDTFAHALVNRYAYSLMLVEHWGAGRVKDIEEIIKPVVSLPPSKFKNYPFGLYLFFETAIRGDKNSFVYKNINALAKVSPSFKLFLNSRGLKLD